jgi:hypothetical protein
MEKPLTTETQRHREKQNLSCLDWKPSSDLFMKRAMKLSAGNAACFPLPRLAGEGGPAGPGEGVHFPATSRRKNRWSTGVSSVSFLRRFAPKGTTPSPAPAGSTAEARGEDDDGLSKPCPERLKFLIHQERFCFSLCLCVSVVNGF